ncbi:MAG: molybdopterin-dependent oxidoreductase [Candidatus Bathyarchaeia archaeon]|jgi:PKD repeat protein
MRKRLRIASLILVLIFALVPFLPALKTASALQASGVLKIDGSVNTPLSLTYAELLSFPLVSEVARIKCVAGPPDVIYNWTGIPLFYLLTLARIKPEAYKVVTRGSDGFSSDLLVEDALRPSTILALRANGTDLPDLPNGPTGLYRLVVPGKWGYKWVSDIIEIEVVTTDYLGTYEGSGVSSWTDEATVPDYGPLPTPPPSLQTFNLPYGNRTFEVGAFTNASITTLAFDPSPKALNLNMTVPQGSSGFADFILQQDFLRGPYNVTLDEKTISAIEADTNTSSYLYIALDEGFHTTSISGTEFFGHIPEIIVDYNATAYVGQNVALDASKSLDYGRIVSYEWSLGDGANATGAIVSHSYDKEGTYQAKLNVTNDEGISNSETLTITVGSPPEYIPLYVKIFLVAILALLILTFSALLRKRRTEHAPNSSDSAPDTVSKTLLSTSMSVIKFKAERSLQLVPCTS